MLSLNGDINTGITIRTIHLRDGIASYGAGATLLYDSVPQMEAEETRVKATNFYRALAGPPCDPEIVLELRRRAGVGVRLLLVDNDDCFIHTLANYARQTGAEVVTYRAGFPLELIARIAPNIVLISRVPAAPADFGVPQLVLHAAQAGLPSSASAWDCKAWSKPSAVIGRARLSHARKPSVVIHKAWACLRASRSAIKVGRYHSLFARKETFPACSK